MSDARPDSRWYAGGAAVSEEVRGHVVQFYSTDDELVTEVVAHLASALESGGTALAIATKAHRVAFAFGLAQLGIEPRALNRVHLLDAEETLRRFLVDGELDANRFNEVVGDLVAHSQPPVHAFGEMVALLWESGRVQQAIDLEMFWNSLGERYPFVLLCGYSNESCLWAEQASELARVCEIHDAVTGLAAPAPPPSTALGELTDVERVLKLPREPASVRTARALVATVFTLVTGFSKAECEVAELLVSELVTNALDHGSGEVVVKIVVRDRSVLISVSDDDPTEPMWKKVDANSPRGRGLQIVEALSIDWGVTPKLAGGKAVWAELPRKGTSNLQR